MILETEKKRSIGSNFLYSIFITILIGIVNFIYPLVIGLLYGPQIMGNFSVLIYWALLLNIPVSNGLAPALSRFTAASGASEKGIIENTGAKLSFFYYLGVLFIYPVLGLLVFDLSAIELVLIMIFLLGLIIQNWFRYSMQGQERFSALFKVVLISFSVFLPAMICIGILPKVLSWSFFTNNYFFFIIPMLIFYLTFSLIVFISKFNDINLKTLITFPKITKNILLYALFIGFGGLLAIGMSKIQVIVTDLHLQDEFQLGVLSFWDSAIAVIIFLTIAIRGILVPRVTNLLKSKNQDNSIALDFISKLSWGFTLVIASIAGLVTILIGAYPGILDTLTFNKYNMTVYWLVAVLLIFKEINFLILIPSLSFIRSSEKYVRINPISTIVSATFIVIS
ncbi:MAG: hypothetical protein ACTSSH_05850, partial [Candidatus Heimdallarchaeota archaeon]